MSGDLPMIMIGILAGALAVATGWAFWVMAQRRELGRACDALTQDRDRLSQDLTDADRQVDALRAENADLGKQIAVVQETHKNVQAQFDKAQQQLRETFNALASDALVRNSKQFLQLAAERLKSERTEGNKQLDAAKQRIEAMVKPIDEKLSRYDQAMKAVEQSRRQAYGSLSKQVEMLVADQKLLRRETASLAQALRKPQVRGRWGQVQLRRVAELAGMVPYCDFEEEHVVRGDQGTLRPDMIVRLPNGRTIVVDAKTPLDAYLDALESQEDEARDACMQKHAQQLAAKVKDLSAKRYQDQFERSPDFVVLFIPGDVFLFAAQEKMPRLSEAAMQDGVVIATPSTLVSLLKAVALGWREQQMADHARQISQLGRELHKRIAKAAEHLSGLGSALGKTVTKYNQFVGSFETRVAPTARKLEQLGAQSGEETSPQSPPTVDHHPRPVTLTATETPRTEPTERLGHALILPRSLGGETTPCLWTSIERTRRSLARIHWLTARLTVPAIKRMIYCLTLGAGRPAHCLDAGPL